MQLGQGITPISVSFGKERGIFRLLGTFLETLQRPRAAQLRLDRLPYRVAPHGASGSPGLFCGRVSGNVSGG